MFLELQVSWRSTYCSWACLEVVSLYVSLSHPSSIRGKAEECSLGDGRGTRRQVETEKAYENLDLGMAHHYSCLILWAKASHTVELQVKQGRKVGGGGGSGDVHCL